MKKLVREYQFDDEQLNRIRSLAKTLGLTETTVKLLVARGVDSVEKIQNFLSPSKEHFLSPFLMSGMARAVELIKQAQTEGWNVAVFGDYDADGVCASSIMYYTLQALGIEPYIFIPERTDGYGLSVTAIDKILDDFFPDLFITVDCGISCYKEVEYLKEQGVEVVVTDHHELPEILPDCTCINPKLTDDYPYDNLCGAGVAFKVACALLGEEAYSLLDFAALATVADSVPLLGENRDIVHEGIKVIQNSPRLAFSTLLGKQANENVTSQTLSFTLAPRINAAGRLGDAASALRLFVSQDPLEVYDLAVKLNEYNTRRQRCCDELYESAKQKIRQKGAFGNVIMLADENWSTGFVGIVAAKLAEEYSRPALLFVKNGDMLKGSARSIESINIFEALRGCNEYIAEFGGHAQAAGINVTEENFPLLERALDEYIGRCYTAEDFSPILPVSEEITGEFSSKLAHELNALEPYGVGHKKPLFYFTARALNVKQNKSNSPHLQIRTPHLELMYFSGAKHTKLLESDVEKKIVFECNCSTFRGKEYVKGFVRDIVYDGYSSQVPAWRFSTTLKRLQGKLKRSGEGIEYITKAEMEELIKAKRNQSPYGLCVVAPDSKTAKSYESVAGMSPDLITLSARNVANTLIISPSTDVDLSDYRDVVFLDTPFNYNFGGLQNKKIYAVKNVYAVDDLLNLNATREGLLKVFSLVRANANVLGGKNVEETAVNSEGLGFTLEERMFALAVFEELGLIDYESGNLTVYRGVRADLNNSTIFQRVTALQRGN